jgi:hypothetical protein
MSGFDPEFKLEITAATAVNSPQRSGRECMPSAELAERVGFEPTVRFPAHTLSKRAP